MKRGHWHASDGLIALSALLLCGVAAWSISQLGWASSHREFLPFAFLGLVLFLGFRYGRAVGMLGSVVSAAVFAFALYQPVGSLAVSDDAARSALAWAMLAGVSASFLLLPTHGGHHHHRK